MTITVTSRATPVAPDPPVRSPRGVTGDGSGWIRAEDYADAVDERMRGLVLVTAVVEALLAASNVVRLPLPVNLVMGAVQLLAVVALLVMWVALRNRRVPHRTAQPIIAAAITVFSLMLPLEMALTHNGLLTANLGLVMVATGALVVQTRWFVTAIATLVVAWALVILARGPWDLPVDRLLLFVAVAVLIASVVHALRVHGRRQLVAALEQARTTALRDDLTGLWNRRGGREAIRHVFDRARLTGEPVWAVVLDVAGLKRVNDRCGHPAGDQVLVAVGRAMLSRESFGDVPVRWGGDEFMVVGDGPVPDVDQLIAELMAIALASGGTVDQVWHLDAGVAVTPGPAGLAPRGAANPAVDAVMDRLLADADADLYLRRGGRDPRFERV